MQPPRFFGLPLLLLLLGLAAVARAEVIISESSEPSGLDKDRLFFECTNQYCENNKKIRYFWVYDELFKFHRKYKELGRLSEYSKMSVIVGAFRRIFNEKAILGFYVVRRLKDREVLEIGPFQSDDIPPAFVEKGEGALGRAWQSGETQMVQDANKHPDYFELHSQTQAEICQPVKDPKTGKVVAVFTLNSRFENHFEYIDTLGVKKIMDWMHLL